MDGIAERHLVAKVSSGAIFLVLARQLLRIDRRLRRAALTLALASLAGLPLTMEALSAIACKPILSIKNVREIRTSRLPQPWTWKATIIADRTYCATRSGNFEIDFIRIKEYSPDMQFTEKFRWDHEQFDVSIELAADESILEHRIGFIAPCVCRDYPQ